MSNITFNKEEEKILELGLNYAFERPIKHFLQDLIIDTENAIKQLDVKEQNTYCFLACKKLKQIQNTNTKNMLHKRRTLYYKTNTHKINTTQSYHLESRQRENNSDLEQRHIHTESRGIFNK